MLYIIDTPVKVSFCQFVRYCEPQRNNNKPRKTK